MSPSMALCSHGKEYESAIPRALHSIGVWIRRCHGLYRGRYHGRFLLLLLMNPSTAQECGISKSLLVDPTKESFILNMRGPYIQRITLKYVLPSPCVGVDVNEEVQWRSSAGGDGSDGKFAYPILQGLQKSTMPKIVPQMLTSSRNH